MSTARNDGKRLEYVVALVEGRDLPDGFKVEKNAPVRNDAGDQIAELDVLVSGKVGSVFHKTLFECRDRPSDGPQGAGWIEQLVGRRQLLRLDTVVAVSTTGFSPGAVDHAKGANIHLRRVEELTAEDVQHFLPPRAPLVYREANLTAVNSFVVVPEGETLETIQEQGAERERIEFSTGQKILRNIDTGELHSLLEVWQQLVKLDAYEAEIFGDVKDVGDVSQVDVEIGDDIKNAYRVELEGKRGKIEQLVYSATVRMNPSQAPLAYCVNYDEQHIVAHWQGEGTDNVTVVLTKKEPDAK